MLSHSRRLKYQVFRGKGYLLPNAHKSHSSFRVPWLSIVLTSPLSRETRQWTGDRQQQFSLVRYESSRETRRHTSKMSRCLGLQTCFVENFEFKIAKIPLTEAAKCQRCWGKHMSHGASHASQASHKASKVSQGASHGSHEDMAWSRKQNTSWAPRA